MSGSLFGGQEWSGGGAPFDRFVIALGKTTWAPAKECNFLGSS